MTASRVAPQILTITLNPALDVTTSVGHLAPVRKLRCEAPQYEAGGGGVNVSRAIRELGGECRAFIATGGGMEGRYRKLVRESGLNVRYWHVEGELRFSLTVIDRGAGQHYRFVLPGPEFAAEQVDGLLSSIMRAMPSGCRFVVGSGSLPPGMPVDFYGRLARLVHERGAFFILDTHGAPLRAALEQRVFVVRINAIEANELARLASISSVTLPGLARQLIERYPIDALLVGNGAEGTLLTTADAQCQVRPPKVEVVSGVGAGDSFLGAFTLALQRDWSMKDALRYGVAAAASAVGTDIAHLCDRDATERYFRIIRDEGEGAEFRPAT